MSEAELLAQVESSDLDAADGALETLLAAGWKLELLPRSFKLTSPSGYVYAPGDAYSPGACGPS